MNEGNTGSRSDTWQSFPTPLLVPVQIVLLIERMISIQVSYRVQKVRLPMIICGKYYGDLRIAD